jgi:hypothetical protein
MKQQNFSSARALTMEELENVNGGHGPGDVAMNRYLRELRIKRKKQIG